MLIRLFKSIESEQIGLRSWVWGMCGIILIRILLENFSNTTSASFFTTDIATLLHYALFYCVALLSITLVIHFTSGRPIEVVSRVTLMSLPIILLPPLIDLTVHHGGTMAYIFADPQSLLYDFFTFYGIKQEPGITLGIKIEFVGICLMTFLYLYYITTNFLRSFLGTLGVYTVLFLLISLPSLLIINAVSVPGAFFRLLHESALSRHFFHPTIEFISTAREYEMGFNIAIAQVLYILATLLVLVFLFQYSRAKWRALIGNMRPLRVLYYLSLLVGGVFFASYVSNSASIKNWLDVTTLLSIALSFISAWLFAVCQNDRIDAVGDRLSNQSRPLVTGSLSKKDMRTFEFIFLLSALVGGYVGGHHALFFVLAFTALYYVYSMPPFRLKRFPLLNPCVIALCALSTILAGFFTISADSHVHAFKLSWLMYITVFFTLIANVKDIKDYEGDREEGVMTIPVLMGRKWGTRVIGLGTVGALFLVPLAFRSIALVYAVIFYSIFSYFLITRTSFSEKYLFYLFFAFMVTCLVILSI